MRRASIIDFVDSNPNQWFDGREIAEKIGVSQSTVVNTLRKIRIHNELNWREVQDKKTSCIKFIYSSKSSSTTFLELSKRLH